MNNPICLNITNGELVHRSIPILTQPLPQKGREMGKDIFDYMISSVPGKSCYIQCDIDCDNLENVQKTVKLILDNTSHYTSLEEITSSFSKLYIKSFIGNKEVNGALYSVFENHFNLYQDNSFMRISFKACSPAQDDPAESVKLVAYKLKEIMPAVRDKIELENQIKISPSNTPSLATHKI